MDYDSQLEERERAEAAQRDEDERAAAAQRDEDERDRVEAAQRALQDHATDDEFLYGSDCGNSLGY